MELESGLNRGRTMKRIRFTEEQIIAVLREDEAGAKAADLASPTNAAASATAVCSFCCGNKVSRQASTAFIGSTAKKG